VLMAYIADFHIHSKYSRATARHLDLENLYIAAQMKGVTVLGTGDFTHPGWLSEIRSRLSSDDSGLLQLKPALAAKCNQAVPAACRRDVRFMLVTEISNIYKKNGKTRKNHNLVFLPDLTSVEKFNARLAKIGNVESDGRPILGLDAKHLLEIVLETCPTGFLVPAHIWTPWFSLFGSKSGFDAVQECFEDLADQIFAVETGLSSDPAMNWRVKDLDGRTLISNSDAHSPVKVGREANILETPLSFDAIKCALATGNAAEFLGTLEFFPEEGKYHLDGHRKCGVRMWPAESRRHNGLCPVCGRPMTLGVLNRVEALAQRTEGGKPEKTHPFYRLIPLHDVLAALLDVGPNTQKVGRAYHGLLEKLGPELHILHQCPLHALYQPDLPLFQEAVRRIRENRVQWRPGYDGEFGRVEIFSDAEKQRLLGQMQLFRIACSPPDQNAGKFVDSALSERKIPADQKRRPRNEPTGGIVAGLNPEQRRAVLHSAGPMLIVAGPGTGKTRTITHRIAYLIDAQKADPADILVLTFTRKAAEELVLRLKSLIKKSAVPLATTFHAFCVQVLTKLENNKPLHVIDQKEQESLVQDALMVVEAADFNNAAGRRGILEGIVRVKQELMEPGDVPFPAGGLGKTLFTDVFKAYERMLSIQGMCDYEDLIRRVVMHIESSRRLKTAYRKQFSYVFVDEYQDINYAQYRLIRALSPPHANLCAIGDPDQSIYGFRGSDVRYFHRFGKDYPDAARFCLSQNYRSTQTIVDAAAAVVKNHHKKGDAGRLRTQRKGPDTLDIIACRNEKSEAVAVGKRIESLVGGIGFHSIDFGKAENRRSGDEWGFGDIAVLVRTTRQVRIFMDVFRRAGIPFQAATTAPSLTDKGLLALLSYLKIVNDTGGFRDFEQIVAFSGVGIGRQTLVRLKKWAYLREYGLHEALRAVRRFPVKGLRREVQQKLNHFLDRMDDTKEKCSGKSLVEQIQIVKASHFINPASRSQADDGFQAALDVLTKKAAAGDNNPVSFFQEMGLRSDTDAYEEKAEKVVLMTMHAAKGLEFPIVFICGCEDGLIPFRHAQADPILTNLPEERRLFYVALTRAGHKLFLSFVNTRRVFGRCEKMQPSPFLKDIPQCLKTVEKQTGRLQNRHQQTQLSLF